MNITNAKDTNKYVGMLFFGDRKKLDDKYKEWIKENEGVADVSFNVITFLESKGLLDYSKVNQFLNENKKG